MVIESASEAVNGAAGMKPRSASITGRHLGTGVVHYSQWIHRLERRRTILGDR